MATTLDIQRRLSELGFSPGPLDGLTGPQTRAAVMEFQRANGLVVDGIVGPITTAALFPADAAPAPAPPPAAGAGGGVPAAWMPNANIVRIHVHWTAGGHKANATDKKAYHFLIEGDGRLVRGNNPISTTTAHTRGANTGAAAVALCCMAGAVESPFNAGRAPMTRVQWDALPPVLASLCRRYGLAVSPHTVLSHAEVQGTLGKPQSGKWDITRLPFDLNVRGATAVGNLFRQRTSALLAAA